MGTGYSNEDEGGEKKSCPRDGLVLVYRDDISSFFCVKCAYTPPPVEMKKVEPPDNTQEEREDKYYGVPMTSPDGFISQTRWQHADINDAEDQAMKIRPVGQQKTRESNRPKYAGLDGDLQMLIDKGYQITSSEEQVSSDGTYNVQEMMRRKRGYF